jgi:hypothetical protein
MQIKPKNNFFSSLFFAALFIFPTFCFAASLVWEPPNEGTVTGYKVHYSQSSTAPAASINAGNVTQYNLDNAPLSEKTTYYFWVTAYNTAAESPPAGPVSYTTTDNTPPVPPNGLVVN